MTKEQILDAVDLPLEEIEIEEWGGSVFMRGLTAEERDIFEASFMDDGGEKRKTKNILLDNLRTKLVSLCLCNESGERLFQESDIKSLGKKNSHVIDRLFLRAQALSGIGEDGVKNLSKNSEGE